MSELTKQYFDKQLGKLATKEEIKKLATKEEIKKLATKEEIKKLATKENIKDLKVELETKIENEVGRLETTIENEIAGLAGMTSRRFDELERKLDVRAEVDQLKVQMKKVWEALNMASK